jgi:DeoR family transcriptional regulator of aga operon
MGAARRQARMIAAERHQHILDTLAERSAVSVQEICESCGVSAVTARADLSYLEEEGKLKRTHGGAVPVSSFVIPRVPQRIRKNAAAKHAIGLYAATMVRDGDTILVGSGSTTLEFLHCLQDLREITVITDDYYGLEYVEQHLLNATPVCTGGTLGRQYRHFYGPMLADSLANVYIDKVFLGADAFEPDFGFLAEFEQTASAKAEFLRHARTRVMLMDSSKVGASRSFVRFAGPADMDVVVMDRDPSGIVGDAMREAGGTGRVVATMG